MRAIVCLGGYQCEKCYRMMYIEPSEEAEKYNGQNVMYCANKECEEYNKLYLVPKIELELAGIE